MKHTGIVLTVLAFLLLLTSVSVFAFQSIGTLETSRPETMRNDLEFRLVDDSTQASIVPGSGGGGGGTPGTTCF